MNPSWTQAARAGTARVGLALGIVMAAAGCATGVVPGFRRTNWSLATACKRA
jgi:hypothetical protein